MYIVNVNDHKYEFRHVRDMIAFVLGIPIKRQSSSLHAMKANCNEAVDLINELLMLEREGKTGSEKSSLTRLMTRLDKFKEIALKKKHVSELISTVFNQILAFEGIGTLVGFGMCTNHGDRVLGNPEMTSILPPEIKKKRRIVNASKQTGATENS